MNIEITRAFSQKKNLGNYEMQDSFCSAKIECDISQVEEKSKMLDEIVQREVNKSLAGLIKQPEPQGLVIEEELKFDKEI
jgi:hypothetical protein